MLEGLASTTHAQTDIVMAADWKDVAVEGSKVTEELKDDRPFSCTGGVGLRGGDVNVHQTRSSQKQHELTLIRDDTARGGGERVLVKNKIQSRKGRESTKAMKTSKGAPHEVGKDPRGIQNASQREVPKRQAEGSEQKSKRATALPQKDPRIPPHKMSARKTALSAASNKKKELVKSLMNTKSKASGRKSGHTVSMSVTARKSCPSINMSALHASKKNVNISSKKRIIFPIKFEFQRAGQTVQKRKTGPVAGNGNFSHLQLANTKASLTSLKPGLVCNGLPPDSGFKGNKSKQSAAPPKQSTAAPKSLPTPGNQAEKKAGNTEVILQKRSHQIRFSNNRTTRAITKENGNLPFDLGKSLKRNASSVLENSSATKKLKSSSLMVPAVVQRAVMLGLVQTSALSSGLVGPSQFEGPGKTLDQIDKKNTKANVQKRASKEINQKAKTTIESLVPHIQCGPVKDHDDNIEHNTDSDTLIAESPKSPQVDDQDFFVDDDPPKLISSRDLEAQAMSSSDETPELERQPPPDIMPAEQPHQMLHSTGENQSSTERDNPTPTPGTTASSSNPRHVLAADFPVGAAGSATPDSSATESCPSDVNKKKKRHPRTATHFGMKRHRTGRATNKMNSYDSDSTDVQSEAGSENQISGEKNHLSSSTSRMASLESDVDYVQKGRLDGHTTSNHHIQSELPLCCCRMEQKGPSSVILSTCRALEVIDSELVECKNKISTGKLHRPSSRVPYGAFCSDHRTLMTQHKCCPGCGCFCTTGIVVVCNPDDKDKNPHHFHRECIVDMAGALYCPHCGSTTDLQEISIPSNGNMATLRKIPKSMIVSGVVKLPKSLLGKLTGCVDEEKSIEPESTGAVEPGPRAKMTMANKDKPESSNEEDDYANLPSQSITLKSGMTVISNTLPPGPRRDVLESAMEYLNTESPKRMRFFPKNTYTAVSQGDMGKVLQMLAEGFDPNYRFPTHNLETTLHPAAAKGQLEIIVMLLQAGANIDAQDEDYKTPLQMAVENGHNDCMRYLIKHGATVDHKDDDGMTILHLAARNGNLEAVKYIMSRRKINANAQDDGGWTPIIWAAEYKHIPVVQYLIERGADPNIRDKEGNSCLHWAVFSGADDVAEIFLNRHCDVQAPNVHGDTPLHIASRENNYGCVTMLLLRNANITATNHEEETPLGCAKPDSDVALALQVNQKMMLAIGNRAIRTEKIISRDIARGLEALPIAVVNAVNNDPIPTDFHYVAKSCESTQLHINYSIKKQPMCTCSNEDCSTDACECAGNSVQCWYDSAVTVSTPFLLLGLM